MIDNKIITDIVQNWADDFLSDIEERAREKVSSSDGNFDIQVVKNALTSGTMVIMNFDSHLRLFDMKRVKRERNLGPIGIERIKDWIQRKGVQSFLKKYPYPLNVRKSGQVVPVPITRILNNIAWGISRKKKKLRRKKWYNQQKGSKVYKLYFDLIDTVVDAAIKEHKTSITNPPL